MDLDDVPNAVAQQGQRLAWWLVLRGFFSIAFGVLFMTRPSEGVGVLLGVFSAWCLFDGILALGSAMTGDALRSRALLAIEALLSIAAGIIVWAMPGHVAIAVLFVMGARALVLGALEIIAALRLGHAVPNPWLLALSGVVSIGFGIALMAHPAAGVLALAWLVGLYGLLLGVSELAAAAGLAHFIQQHGRPLRTGLSHS